MLDSPKTESVDLTDEIDLNAAKRKADNPDVIKIESIEASDSDKKKLRPDVICIVCKALNLIFKAKN